MNISIPLSANSRNTSHQSSRKSSSSSSTSTSSSISSSYQQNNASSSVPPRNKQLKPTLQCQFCKSTIIDKDESSGTTTCTGCGAVLEENCIVSSVQFSETGNGGTAIIGQFVSATCTKPFSGTAGTNGHPFSKESREITINNGRKRISQLAAALRLGQHYVESAHRLFLIAVTRNFVQGRRTANVVAACLYIVCRRNKAPYLLIDFSDVLQTNVYILGTCFVKFCRMLNVTLPQLDPTLYIHRFASKLNFGSKKHQVAMTAIRLVQRFKRDWIQTGRRPAGICAAALLLAGRMHGFDRSRKNVVSVVRVCDQTLRNRLDEFSCTPTADLTIEEFARIDLPNACDPPAFIAAERSRHEKESKQKELLDAKRAAEAVTDDSVQQMQLIMDAIDGDGSSSTATSTATTHTDTSNANIKKDASSSSTTATSSSSASSSSSSSSDLVVINGNNVQNNSSASFAQKKYTKPLPAPLGGRVRPMRQKKMRASSDKSRAELEDMYTQLATVLNGANGESISRQELEKSKKDARKIALKKQLSELDSNPMPTTEATVDSADEEATEEDLLDVASDNEGDNGDGDDLLLLSNEEVEKKKKLWLEMNKKYLEDKKNKDIHEAASGPKIKKKRRKKGEEEEAAKPADSATQAVMDMAKVKRLSKKINYEALKMLFPGDAQYSLPDPDQIKRDQDDNNSSSSSSSSSSHNGNNGNNGNSSSSSSSSRDIANIGGPSSPSRRIVPGGLARARNRNNRLAAGRKRLGGTRRSALSARHTTGKKRMGSSLKGGKRKKR